MNDGGRTQMATDYGHIPDHRRVHSTLNAARQAHPEPGESVVLRNFAELVPDDMWSQQKVRGKWQLLPYELSDGAEGSLLVVNDVAADAGAEAVPPEFEIAPDLTGWYAIWVGVPSLDLKPILSFNFTAIDIALDGEPFGGIGPEFGRRRNRLMGPTEVEVNCFWRCVRLDGRTLRFRSPYGTFATQPLGLVRSIISSIRLIKLSEEQIKAYQDDITDPAHKKVLHYCDGFSHYFTYGEPGMGIDEWFPENYAHSDYKICFYQTPSTGVANWPSQVTNLVGEGISDEDWKSQHTGERRCHEYVKWASENGQEGMRVLPGVCRRAGTEFHASLRMNIYQSGEHVYGPFEDVVFNGKWWFEHPEARKQPIPGDDTLTGRTPSWVRKYQLDYAHPAARQFIMDILTEIASQYDVDGMNLDFTRWPPVADHKRHDFDVLTSFIKQVRRELDRIGSGRDRRIEMSATLVEGFNARDEHDNLLSLEQQKIDLEAWLASGALDFICVQTTQHEPLIAMAHRYGVKYFCQCGNGPLDDPEGGENVPEWCDADDPQPGEELMDQPPVSPCLDPLEIYEEALKYYRAGADGISFLNMGGRSLGRLGHIDEIGSVSEHDPAGDMKSARTSRSTGSTIQRDVTRHMNRGGAPERRDDGAIAYHGLALWDDCASTTTAGGPP